MSVQILPQHDFKFLAGSPVVFHCNHFNLFLDQTIDDALGEKGPIIRFESARRAAGEMLSALFVERGVHTPIEKLELAKAVFASMGHGRLVFEVDSEGGRAIAPALHYGFTWREKYGDRVSRRSGVDAFAAGFVAAATGLAFGKGAYAFTASESECLATRHPNCRFIITPDAGQEKEMPPVDRAAIEPNLPPPLTGVREDEIVKITNGLNQFLAGVTPDDRGLVEAFGVFVTLHLANYYNGISFRALDELAALDDEFAAALGDLLRESGHVCVFNTFGGIILSPEWEGMVGTPTDDPEQIIVWCLAIARALGFGHWALSSYDAGKSVTVVTASNYESPYFQTRHGSAANAPEFFMQGAVMAIMELAHRVKWSERPQLTPELYASLFQGEKSLCVVEQDSAASLGDACSRVTVRRKS